MNFARVDQFLTELEQMGIAGTDCCIYLNNQLVHRHTNGWADRENKIPVSENTLFRMFSMTKPVTCVAALQLLEQGKFLLTDPVSDILPEFAGMRVKERLTTCVREITMRDLFAMTAGISYELYSPSLLKLYNEKPGEYTTREYVQAIAKEPLLFEPGDHWYYGLCHDVLAACVEVLSGMRFSDYLRRNVFGPLDITDWYFWLPEHEAGRSCVRYEFDTETKTFIRPSTEAGTQRFNMYQMSKNLESGGAGLTTTVEEYAKFAMMLTGLGVGANGVRILSRRTVELMRENQLGPVQMEDFNWTRFAGYGYGLGVRTLVSRGGAGSLSDLGEFGWGGAGGTYAISDPSIGLTAVYAQEANPSNEGIITPRLRNLIYAALED